MYRPTVNVSDRRWSNKIHNAFPSFMNQREGSDNQHLLSVITQNANTYKNDVGAFTNARLLQNANGKFLDAIASDWGVNIIDENDDTFKKFQIRFQMLRHRLGPGTNDIKGAIAFLFNIPENAFNIVSTGVKAIKVTNLPFNFDTGDKTEIKHELIAKYIRGMMPPEYELVDVEYQSVSDFNFYVTIDTPKEPYFENVIQYVPPFRTHANLTVSHYTNSIHFTNVIQQYPVERENANTYNAYNASRIYINNVTQKERTMATPPRIGWTHNSFHVDRFHIANVNQERKDKNNGNS